VRRLTAVRRSSRDAEGNGVIFRTTCRPGLRP